MMRIRNGASPARSCYKKLQKTAYYSLQQYTFGLLDLPGGPHNATPSPMYLGTSP